MKNEEFKDKAVLITGSSRGIGKATPIAMSNLGASLVINGRDKERLIKVENLIKNFILILFLLPGYVCPHVILNCPKTNITSCRICIFVIS